MRDAPISSDRPDPAGVGSDAMEAFRRAAASDHLRPLWALRFSGNCDVVRKLLAKVETWRMWVLCDREPAKTWSKGRVTLLGDAAHPMLQYLAQGACMALEDAVELAQFLARTPSAPEVAFKAYADNRYLRTGKCQIMARVYGGFYHAQDVTRELANGFLASRTPEASYESLNWLYDYDSIVEV